jgi:hypothetical protein
MEAMVKTVFNSSPGAVVILSTLLPNKNSDTNIEDINVQYRELVAKLLDEKYKIQLADVHDGFLTMDDIFDGTHPTRDGAEKMASVWYLAIEEVDKKGWLQEPSKDVDFSDVDGNQQCDKTFQSGESDPRSNVQFLCAGSGHIFDDGTYVHKSEEQPKGSLSRYSRRTEPFETRDRLYAAQIVNAHGGDRGGERDDSKQIPAAFYFLIRIFRKF